MNKFYIVEDIRFDSKFKSEEEIKELEWKQFNGLGVWSSEGKTEDERINNPMGEGAGLHGSLSYIS